MHGNLALNNGEWMIMPASFFKRGSVGYIPKGHPQYKGSCCEAFELNQAAEEARKRKEAEARAKWKAEMKRMRSGL